jgi:magnesium transporter
MDTDLILLQQFINKHPKQAALIIEGLEDEEVAAFLGEIPPDLAVNLTSLMNSYKVAKCLKLINADLAIELLEKSDVQKAELLLRSVDEDFRGDLLSRLSPKLSTMLLQKLNYTAYTVGALMIPLNLSLRKDMIVRSAIQILKSEMRLKSPTVCIVDENGTLIGIIRLHELLLANETDEISTIMETDIPWFFVDLPIESIENHPGWSMNQFIPVVDSAKKLVGILNFEATRNNKRETTQEQIMQVMETSNALGELYRIGLTAFLQSVSK